MEEFSWQTSEVLKEWDVLCETLAKALATYEAGKDASVEREEQGGDSDCSKELDLFLRLYFAPPPGGIPPGTFAELPPVLEPSLRLRVGHAAILLKRLLERNGGLLRLPVSPHPKDALYRFFQSLLLPSPPKPGEYYIRH